MKPPEKIRSPFDWDTGEPTFAIEMQRYKPTVSSNGKESQKKNGLPVMEKIMIMRESIIINKKNGLQNKKI
jgi:hypothetical protein